MYFKNNCIYIYVFFSVFFIMLIVKKYQIGLKTKTNTIYGVYIYYIYMYYMHSVCSKCIEMRNISLFNIIDLMQRNIALKQNISLYIAHISLCMMKQIAIYLTVYDETN